ncbi:MAG: pseudouridine synthase [Rhizobacter sp.]|nr:pseudouridine synthase [Rhizobacter sp.]
MATIKLKKPDAHAPTPNTTPASRAPVRGTGAGVKARPTLAQAQAMRVEREERYQEQLRQRFGDRPPPPTFTRRDEPAAAPRQPDERAPPQRQRRDEAGTAARPRREEPAPMARLRRDTAPAPLRPDISLEQLRRNAPPANTAFGRRPEREQPPQPAFRPEPARQPAPRGRGQRRERGFRDHDEDDRDDREPQEHAPGSLRLSKRMSELGMASRREADEWIAQGWVRVDDQVVKELGSRVLPGQRVTVDAKAKYQQAQRVTVLINKPVGYVSGQAEDGYEPAVVLVTPQNQWREDHSGTRFLREHLRSLVPAGRLDIDSVGLLVLTQDGRVAKQLIGEDTDIEKEYLVRVALPGNAKLPGESLDLLRHGLELDGEALRPAQVEWVNDDQLRFVLRQGKKRQIRRMCEAVGLQVLGLKRVRIGTVMLGDLPTGQWRYLRMDEGFAAV